MTLLTPKNGRQEQIIEPVSFPRDPDERTVINHQPSHSGKLEAENRQDRIVVASSKPGNRH
jgi:hypothetical protein